MRQGEADAVEFGSFYLGGRTVRISGRAVEHVRMTDLVTLPQDPNGDHCVDQAYVQWFRPRGGGPKIVFQHGGGLCGSHMTMMDENSREVAEAVADRLSAG